jgi:hypothetical protein
VHVAEAIAVPGHIGVTLFLQSAPMDRGGPNDDAVRRLRFAKKRSQFHANFSR